MSTEVAVGTPRGARPFRQVSTLQMALIVVLIASIGGLLLYLGGRNDLWRHHQGLQTLANNLGSILIVSVALALIWEFMGKRSFTREILETAQTSTDVHAAGITRIGMNYTEDADWEALFNGVQKLDIFVAYGRTWRNSHISKLRRVADDSGARIRIYLPDPNDPYTVSVLAERFDMPEPRLKDAINESKIEFTSLERAGGAQIDVFYRKGDMVFSCYRFDATAVVTLYTHSRARGQVPVIVCRSGGSFYEFLRGELKAIHTQSTVVP
ncbi:hypothetical protein [Actinomadura geliboluensis]|uniref:hypothetical protein n=1 Tax=Actinomadura geliboluensis TaxID=882440 RepID=UPI0036A06C6D